MYFQSHVLYFSSHVIILGHKIIYFVMGMFFGHTLRDIFIHLKFYHVRNIFNHKLKWLFFIPIIILQICMHFLISFFCTTFSITYKMWFFLFWMSSKKRRKDEAMMFELWKPNLATYHCYWLSTLESFYLCGHIVYLYGHNMHTI